MSNNIKKTLKIILVVLVVIAALGVISILITGLTGWQLIKVFAVIFGIIVVISILVSFFNRDKGAKVMNVLFKGLLATGCIALIALLLASVMGLSIIKNENGGYKIMRSANILNDTMDLPSGIHSLDFELISENIKIVATDSDTWRLEYSWIEWDDKPSISINGGELVYKTGEKQRHVISNFFHNAARPPITLYVPKGASFEDVTVRTSSGNIEVKEIEAEALSAYSTSGKITVKKASLETIQIATSTGSVTLNDLKGVNLTLRVSSADVLVEDVSFESYNAEILSGNITTRRLNAEKANFTTLTGNVNLDLIGSEDEYTFVVNSQAGIISNIYLNNKNIGGGQTYVPSSNSPSPSPNVGISQPITVGNGAKTFTFDTSGTSSIKITTK